MPSLRSLPAARSSPILPRGPRKPRDKSSMALPGFGVPEPLNFTMFMRYLYVQRYRFIHHINKLNEARERPGSGGNFGCRFLTFTPAVFARKLIKIKAISKAKGRRICTGFFQSVGLSPAAFSPPRFFLHFSA